MAASRQLQIVLRHLRRLAGTAGAGGVTDGQLLERFVTQHTQKGLRARRVCEPGFKMIAPAADYR
jgi:hypothetical protein